MYSTAGQGIAGQIQTLWEKNGDQTNDLTASELVNVKENHVPLYMYIYIYVYICIYIYTRICMYTYTIFIVCTVYSLYIFPEHVVRQDKKATEGPEQSYESRKLIVDCLFAIQRT